MNRLPVLTAAFLIVPTASMSASDESFGDYRPQLGEVHPGFVLPRIDTGEPVSLSQNRGKKILLVHFAVW